MYGIGFGKEDITPTELGMCLLGYGKHDNIAKSVDEPLFARATVFEDDKHRIVGIVNLEIAFPSIALTERIIERLSEELSGVFEHNNLMISAQHTHSAPGGFSHYIFYNIPTPGFNQHVFTTYVEGTVKAVVSAYSNRQKAKLSLAKGSFNPNLEVAFNRSLSPYNNNQEVTSKATRATANLAVDREMKLLKVVNEEGETIGALNWFGVHTTSISNDNTKISGDNKGFAATFLEDDMRKSKGNKEFVGLFLQDACGDVSPNFIYDKKKKWTRGKFEDDFDSARYNGQLQADKANELINNTSAENIEGAIDCVRAYYDMSCVQVDPVFINGIQNKRTVSPHLGISFFGGTKEGPGVSKGIRDFVKTIYEPGKWLEGITYKNQLPKDKQAEVEEIYEMQDPKTLALDVGNGRTFLIGRIKNLFFIPNWVDPLVGRIKHLDKLGKLKKTPWIGKVLPLQISVIGKIAIVGLPAEITTIAAQRLRATILEVLQKRGVEHIQLTSYSNAYAGYITTHEEYEKQNYEGGHTLFGKWTLGAFQTKFRQLAEALLLPKEERNAHVDTAKPDLFRPEEIWMGDM